MLKMTNSMHPKRTWSELLKPHLSAAITNIFSPALTCTGLYTLICGRIGCFIRDNIFVKNCNTTCFMPGGHWNKNIYLSRFVLTVDDKIYFIWRYIYILLTETGSER